MQGVSLLPRERPPIFRSFPEFSNVGSTQCHTSSPSNLHILHGGFQSIGVPPVIIHFSRIFPNKNQPFFGVPPWPWKAPTMGFQPQEATDLGSAATQKATSLPHQHQLRWSGGAPSGVSIRGTPQNCRMFTHVYYTQKDIECMGPHPEIHEGFIREWDERGTDFDGFQ